MGQRTLATEWGQGRGCVFEREKKAGRATEREERSRERERERIEFDKETRLWEPLYPVSLFQLIFLCSSFSFLFLFASIGHVFSHSRLIFSRSCFPLFCHRVSVANRQISILARWTVFERGSADASRRVHTARCIFRSRVINSVQRGLKRLLSRRRPSTRGITES